MSERVPPDQRDRQAHARRRRREAVTLPRYGTRQAAGPYAGRGIMLGSNPDVWEQALGLARGGFLDCVAFPVPLPMADLPFRDLGVHVVEWCPPERAPSSLTSVFQAENQQQWDDMLPALEATLPSRAVILNSWTYGRFPPLTVALVELYLNEGWGVDFGIFANYTSQGAAAVIPVCGGYSAAGRSDAEAAALYAGLPRDLPGLMVYAGESPITAETLGVLKAWPA